MDPNATPPTFQRGRRAPRWKAVIWQVGRRPRWVLHATILLVVGLSLLVPWVRNGGTVQAENQIVPDESVWNSALESNVRPASTPNATPDGFDLTPSATTTVTPDPTLSAGTPTATPSASPTGAPTEAEASPTPSPIPNTSRPAEPRKYYQVSAGDTMGRIAERFGVSQDTVLWANGLASPNSLSVGQTLLILPVSGLAHQVKDGDSLSSIALQYGVTVPAIAESNRPGATDILQVGETLVIPGGRPAPVTATPTNSPVPTSTPPPTATRVPPTAAPKPPTSTPVPPPLAAAQATAPAPAPAAAAPAPAPVKDDGQLAWPVAGMITQQFGEAGHSGIDIATGMGTPVRAAAEGKVVNLQQTDSGYGWYVVIDHGNGLKSLYAHLGAFNVKLGDTVKRGQQLGSAGMTGKTTGPHLHFEVRSNDRLVNPLTYLP